MNKNSTIKNECYSCGGKGFYTQMHGVYGASDFGGDGFEVKPTIHKYPCKTCNGTGKQNQPTIKQEEAKYPTLPTEDYIMKSVSESTKQGECNHIGWEKLHKNMWRCRTCSIYCEQPLTREQMKEEGIFTFSRMVSESTSEWETLRQDFYDTYATPNEPQEPAIYGSAEELADWWIEKLKEVESKTRAEAVEDYQLNKYLQN